MTYQSLIERENWEGVAVLVRADFNVPLTPAREIADSFRIEKALPTLNYLIEHGAKVIVASHIGRDPEATLAPVVPFLKKHFSVTYLQHILGEKTKQAVDTMKDGELLLLENIRQDPREVANDTGFAQELAALADCYVNEAFPVCHRSHASIVGVPQYVPSYAGFQLQHEIQELQKMRENPQHPFLFIIGGAKFETKLPLIETYLDRADGVFVAGALMSEFFQARGQTVGKSKTAEEEYSLTHLLDHPSLILPEDVLVETASKEAVEKMVGDIADDDMIVDVGSKSLATLRENVMEAKTILWNGPSGYYERGYTHATKTILSMLEESNAETVVGGGDTVALIRQEHAGELLSFVSTGGGAMLAFLKEGTLPGIDALVS